MARVMSSSARFTWKTVQLHPLKPPNATPTSTYAAFLFLKMIAKHSLLSLERQILILEASQPNMRFCVKNEESTAYVMRAYICLRATDVCFDVRGIRLYRVGELFNRSKNVQYKD